MASQSYPSPNAAQVAGGAGPFYGQNGLSPSNMPNDLQLTADLSRHGAPLMGSATNGDMGPSHHHQQHHHRGQQQTSPEQMARGIMSLSEHPDFQAHAQDQSQAHDTANTEGSKKRSKVSRACDECRRKKIRCDATTESGMEPCSNCKRTNASCQFSRQPMKRGPSKGYIKELADRLNNLESQMAPQSMYQSDPQYLANLVEDGQRALDFQGFSPPPGQFSRKRTHSVSEGFSGSFSAPSRAQGSIWSQDPSRHLPHPTGMQHNQTPQSSSGEFPTLSGQRPQLSPNSLIQQLSRGSGMEFSRRDSMSGPFDADQRVDASNTISGLDESILEEYYRIIHVSLPLLSNSKARIRSRLSHCPQTLRDAFITALDYSVRSFPSSNVQPSHNVYQATKRASELISASQYETSSHRTLATNLMYLQTLILMALGSDNQGPAAMRGQLGPTRAEWLGRAVGVATHWKLNTLNSRDSGDSDADEKLGRRVWWILFILDRWHASSTSSLLQLPEHSTQLVPEDMLVLGEATYHLVRLSYILGHLAVVFTASEDVMAPSSSASIVGLIIQGEIDRFRESVEYAIRSSSLVHLSYWHVRLLIQRLQPNSEPNQLLQPAQKMAAMLNSSTTAITPLNHHFAALAALTLVELADLAETRDGAIKGINDIQEALGLQRGLLAHEESNGWDSAIRDLLVKKKQQLQSGVPGPMMALQHLANAAMGEQPGTPGAGGSTTTAAGVPRYDPTLLTRHGYLTLLVQETMSTR